MKRLKDKEKLKKLATLIKLKNNEIAYLKDKLWISANKNGLCYQHETQAETNFNDLGVSFDYYVRYGIGCGDCEYERLKNSPYHIELNKFRKGLQEDREIKPYDNINEAIKNHQVRFNKETNLYWTIINYKNKVIYDERNRNPNENKDLKTFVLNKLKFTALENENGNNYD